MGESVHIPDQVDWKDFLVTAIVTYQDGSSETNTVPAEGEKPSDAKRYVECSLSRHEIVAEVEIVSTEESTIETQR